MKVGIAVDAWKLPVFEKWLNKDGYAFEIRGPLYLDRDDVLVITVETSNHGILETIIKLANDEAKRGQ